MGALPVTLETAKLQLRVDGDDEDSLIEEKLAAAVEVAEKATNRAIARRQWEMVLEGFPPARVRLARPPLAEDQPFEIAYRTDGGVDAVVAPEIYVVEPGEPAELRLAAGATWPVREAGSRVRVRFTAGYAAATLPKSLQDGILLELATSWAFREDAVVGTIVSKAPRSARSLFLRNKVVV